VSYRVSEDVLIGPRNILNLGKYLSSAGTASRSCHLHCHIIEGNSCKVDEDNHQEIRLPLVHSGWLFERARFG